MECLLFFGVLPLNAKTHLTAYTWIAELAIGKNRPKCDTIRNGGDANATHINVYVYTVRVFCFCHRFYRFYSWDALVQHMHTAAHSTPSRNDAMEKTNDTHIRYDVHRNAFRVCVKTVFFFFFSFWDFNNNKSAVRVSDSITTKKKEENIQCSKSMLCAYRWEN